MSNRIFLSPPHMSGDELRFVQEAFASNYIAPLGPMVDAFEREFSDKVGIPYACALSCGTAAIHLALRLLGVGPGDAVFASTLTFIGSVTPIVFQGATPVFIDCDRATWNMDPDLLEAELDACARMGKLPKAVIPTDLYGQCADYDRIRAVCDPYGVPVVADAAEALGAVYLGKEHGAWGVGNEEQSAQRKAQSVGSKRVRRLEGEKVREKCAKREAHSTSSSQRARSAGAGARAAVFSFNGNKIITTSGGGMLASDDKDLIDQARFLSQQARDPFPHYEHTQIGYNYRMSNIVAAIGRGQLRVLDERVRRKREIFETYRERLGDLPGIEFMPEADYGRANRWLTVALITPEPFGADREAVRLALEAENIEARPVWKPMHRQPVFQNTQSAERMAQSVRGKKHGARSMEHRGNAKSGNRKASRDELHAPRSMLHAYSCRVVGGKVAEDLFARGLCLPSGTRMTEADLDRVITVIRRLQR